MNKHDTTIKGDGFTNERKHRKWMNKDETSSPTEPAAELMPSCIINANK